MALTDGLNQSLVNAEENIINLWLVKIQIKISSNHIELALNVTYVIQRKAVENLPEWHFFNQLQTFWYSE